MWTVNLQSVLACYVYSKSNIYQNYITKNYLVLSIVQVIQVEIKCTVKSVQEPSGPPGRSLSQFL